jgi:hypothetical protein
MCSLIYGHSLTVPSECRLSLWTNLLWVPIQEILTHVQRENIGNSEGRRGSRTINIGNSERGSIKNDQVQTFLQELTPTAATDYSLWKATKNLIRITLPSPPLRTHLGTWANSNFDKTRAFAHHLSEIFQPHPSENLPADDEAFMKLLKTPYQLEPPRPSLSLYWNPNNYKQSPFQKIFWLRPHHSPHP